jgi:PAS domain S-box-containing protein
MASLPEAADQYFFQRIADAVPAVVALYNVQSGQYIYVNKTVKKLLGYQPEELLEGGLEFVASLVHPDDVGPLMARNQRAVEKARVQSGDSDEPIVDFEYRMRHRDGEWRWVHTDGTIFERDAEGKPKVLLNVSMDITDHKKIELQLKRSLRALEGALKVD